MKASAVDILVVDDERGICDALKEILEFEGLTVDVAYDGDECLLAIEKKTYSLILLDINMTRMHGRETLIQLCKKVPETKVIMISGNKEPETVAGLMHIGAYHYFTKPFNLGDLLGVVRTVFQEMAKPASAVKNEPSARKTSFAPSLDDLNEDIIGNSPIMLQFKKDLETVAQTDFDILILGENGTGKGLAVNYIHKNSSRRNFKLLTLNCSTVPDDLLTTTLFGNTKNAYNGAPERAGYFEDAEGGIIFLDEIGNVTLVNQSRLLNVLQDRVVTRVGSNKPIKVDVRVISATNENISQRIAKKEFREDLYHRINRLNLEVPPLRKRGDDIILLASYFNQKLALEGKMEMVFFDDGAKEQMLDFAWPGNVRQLENVVLQSIVHAENSVISADRMRKLLQ